MGSNNTKSAALHSAAWTSAQLFDDWFDPIEMGVRDRVRSFIEGMIEAELEEALSRPRYSRPAKTRDGADSVPAGLSGHRHGHRSISLLVVLGVRADGQKVLLAVKNMGGETKEAWRAVLDDLVKRGLGKPELLIVDGGAGLEAALAAIWGDVPTQRCTVHKHRNLLANAPELLHDEITTDYTDMIYAGTPQEVQNRRKAFVRKRRLPPAPVC